jgi:hypothetical protein
VGAAAAAAATNQWLRERKTPTYVFSLINDGDFDDDEYL